MPSGSRRGSWLGTARALGLPAALGLVALATVAALRLADAAVTLPGSDTPVPFSQVAPFLLVLLTVPQLTEPWAPWEAVGARSVSALRSGRWALCLLCQALPTLLVGAAAPAVASTRLAMAVWAVSVLALCCLPRLWWLVPFAGLYLEVSGPTAVTDQPVLGAAILLPVLSWGTYTRWGAHGLSRHGAG